VDAGWPRGGGTSRSKTPPCDTDLETSTWRNVLEAVTHAARWEVRDLLARRAREWAPDLLRGRSGELAVSEHGVDQLLSVALDRAADGLAAGSPDPAIDLSDFLHAQRLPEPLREQVHGLAAALEADPSSGSGLGAARRAGEAWLLDAGEADARLWADPRIPADLELRAILLARTRVACAVAGPAPARPCGLQGWRGRFIRLLSRFRPGSIFARSRLRRSAPSARKRE
jgi:hypothetical protein